MTSLNSSPLGRRRLLSIGGLAAMATAVPLTACSTPTDRPLEPTNPPAGSSTAGSSGAGSSGAGSPGAASPGAPATTVSTADVPVGGGVILEEAPYLVTQPTEGEFKAFSKICTHQGCPVSEIKGESIKCFCHGSEFSITDGSVTQGPATEPLGSVPAAVTGDTITLG